MMLSDFRATFFDKYSDHSYGTKQKGHFFSLILFLIFLIAGCTTVTQLGGAAKSGNIKEVETLINKGADVNETGLAGVTPLYEAVLYRASPDIVRLLLEKGADPNRGMSNGWRPIHLAVDNGDPITVKLLLDSGAKVNVLNAYKKTPLKMAEEKGDMVVAQLLKEKEKKQFSQFFKKDEMPASVPKPAHSAITKGEKVYSDGSKYVGELKNGLPHGVGVHIRNDGSKLSGEFKNGQANGKVVETFPSGTERIGTMVKSQYEGEVTISWKDGIKYKGNYESGKPYDQGTYTTPEGNVLVGNLINETTIVSIFPNTQAEMIGLKTGDIITRYNNTSIMGSKFLANLVSATTPNDVVPLSIIRDGKALEIPIKGGRLGIGINNVPGHIDIADSIRQANITPAKARIGKSSIGNKKQWAVIIGLSTYKYAGQGGLNDLIFADDDAIAFSKSLRNLGWSSGHIKLLTNKQATKMNVQIALESWLSKAGPNDQIILFWAGHGFPDPEDPEKVYFACYDTNINIPVTGYRMDRVRTSLEERKAKNVVVLADTCHAGKLITRGGRGISVMPGIEKMKREQKVPKGWIFMVGADTDRQAIEHTSWSNGAFTHSLVEGLSGKADGYESVGEKNGIVTMRELRAYMNTAMPDETQRVLGVAKRPVITTSTGDPDIWNLTLQSK